MRQRCTRAGWPVCAVTAKVGAASTRQIDLVRKDIPARAPVVVAGDFNDWRQRADVALAGCGLHEVFRRALGQHARSFPAHWPLLRLDRIYVRGVVAARPLVMPRRPWSRLSDHAPLAAEIDVAVLP